MTTTTAQPPRLSALDRCDRCGAQAYVQVELLAGELLFCAHHARQHEEAVRDVAIVVHDESNRLTQTPARSRARA